MPSAASRIFCKRHPPTPNIGRRWHMLITGLARRSDCGRKKLTINQTTARKRWMNTTTPCACGSRCTKKPQNEKYQQELARTCYNRGILHFDAGDWNASESDFRQAVHLLEPLATAKTVLLLNRRLTPTLFRTWTLMQHSSQPPSRLDQRQLASLRRRSPAAWSATSIIRSSNRCGPISGFTIPSI
jgi:hypothetical protein